MLSDMLICSTMLASFLESEWTSLDFSDVGQVLLGLCWVNSWLWCRWFSILQVHLGIVANGYANIEVIESFQGNVDADIDRVAAPALTSFHLGFERNLQAVFGHSRWLWLIPAPVQSGDGIIYETIDLQPTKQKL